MLQCILPGPVSSETTCAYAQYLSDSNICCQKCLPGTKQTNFFSVTFVRHTKLQVRQRVAFLTGDTGCYFQDTEWQQTARLLV